MKLIIDIPEETYKTIINTSFVGDVDLTFKQLAKDIVQTNVIFKLIDAVDNVTFIPDNVTNGDVIMAMFPNANVYEHNGDATYSVNNEYNFNATWWNALYQKGHIRDDSMDIHI